MRSPAASTSSRVSAYVAHRMRSRSQSCSHRSAQSSRLAPNSKSTSPVMPRAAASSSIRRYASGEVPSLPTSVTRRGYAANHSVSRTTESRTGMAKCISAVVFSQAWWPSPLISTTAVSPDTASSSETVTSRSQPAARWPQPTTGRSGYAAIRSATARVASSGERAPGQVEALGGQGPLGQVRVLVPQAGDQPPARGVDLLRAGGPVDVRADRGDDAVGDGDVDGAVGCGVGLVERHEPGVADQQAGHERNANRPAKARLHAAARSTHRFTPGRPSGRIDAGG